MNWLIPVSPRIDDAASVKSKAVSVDTVVGKMEATGVPTILVFLDSCRDNPFPGASRSGTRGLAVVSSPKARNSLIAYATSPGDVAQDGSGRNGVFSGAVIKQLTQPGLELNIMMRNVKAEVAAATGNKQNPRVDDGMKEPFYFVDPALAAARAQAALDKSKSELASLDTALADLQKRIASSGDAQAKQKLQVEQQRQQALQQAKALEAQNLAATAAKQQAAAEVAAKLATEKAAAQEASLKAQSDLSNLAAARRAELDKLAQAAASDNPDVLIDTVERLEKVLAEVDGQYAAALKRSLDAANSGWDKQLVVIKAQQPDITESDAEFAVRQGQEKTELEDKRQAELGSTRANIEGQRTSQTASMRSQFDDTLNTLNTRVWTVTGSSAALTIGTFDRNAKTWPFTVGSADPSLPMVPVNVVVDLGNVADQKAAILSLDAAVKAKALIAEFDWGITRDTTNKRYAIDIRAVRVRNLTSNEVVAQASPQQRAAYFVTGKRAKPTAAVGSISIAGSAKDGAGDVYIDGLKVGSLPYSAKMAEGSFKVEVRWPDLYAKSFARDAAILAGGTVTVTAVKAVMKVGETGPAGGIILYDKGRVSDGWRYLEAAPKDQSTNIVWRNGSYKDIRTDTAVGSGKSNTDAIIAAQGSGNYAASICKNLTLGGYSDWFLPSKDELGLMYTNLKKAGLGGFGGSWLWSSSQYDDYSFAWGQDFSSGGQYDVGKDSSDSVRACRAF
jgi:uncharacterized caspase-like protein